jgi:hypothetical protein
LKGRGSQLEKRAAQGDGQDLLNFEQSGDNNGNSSSFFADSSSLDAGELARRRAKKRRIEDAAAGAGAWIEPPEVTEANQGTAKRSGVSDLQNSNNNYSNNNSNNQNQNTLSLSQAFQFSGGNLERATKMVNEQQQNSNGNELSERTVFAIAARANQFLQDIDSISASQKARLHKKNNNLTSKNGRKRMVRY